MSNYININGELVYAERPVLTAANRGFRYGDALFETIRVSQGRILHLQRHLQRLYAGMQVLGMQISESLHQEAIEREMVRVLKRSRLTEGARMRLSVYRQGEGAYAPESREVGFLISVSAAPVEFEGNGSGMTLDVYRDMRKPIHPLAKLKSANALLYVLAGAYAQAQQVEEVLLLNDAGRVCEGVSSNVFFLVKNRVITPELAEGCIPGVMRQHVLELLRSQGHDVLETAVKPEVLLEADEVFFTNAIQGIHWALAYGTKRYFHKRSEAWLRDLNAYTASLPQLV